MLWLWRAVDRDGSILVNRQSLAAIKYNRIYMKVCHNLCLQKCFVVLNLSRYQNTRTLGNWICFVYTIAASMSVIPGIIPQPFLSHRVTDNGVHPGNEARSRKQWQPS